MQIKRRYLVIGGIIISALLVTRLIQSFLGGSFGLKPATHGCLGARIESKKILKIFPRGHLLVRIPLYLQYNVPRENQNAPQGITTPYDAKYYCLGQDIWLGE